MTREEFIKELNREKYSYEIEGNKIIVTHDRNVWLDSLTSLPPGVVFRNGGYVDLRSLIGGYFDDWKGNIKGIDPKRLLNFMISKGVFER